MEEVIRNKVADRKMSTFLGRKRFEDSLHIANHTKHIGDARHLIYILMAASAIGQGARMLFQGIFAPGSYYVPNVLDLAFDWGILLALGGFVLIDQLMKVSRGTPA